MTKTQETHTPTPWETAVNEQLQWDVCAEGGGDMIADLAHNPNGEADTRFIVRAVNSHAALVEALEATRFYVEVLERSLSADRDPGSAIAKIKGHGDMIRAALTLAKGA